MLILLNGFFAMSEMALVSVRRPRLKQMAIDGYPAARRAMRLSEDPASFLSIVQIGMTLNSVLAGAFSGATMAEPFAVYLNATFPWIMPYGEAAALAITVTGVTYFSLVIGELAPKRIGIVHAEPIAMNVALLMDIFAKAALPIVWTLKKSTQLLLTITGFGDLQTAPVTEEEVKHLIAEGAEAGFIKPAEKAMLDRVMRLADRTLRTIMTPRLDMVWLGVDDPVHEIRKAIRASGYSRFPVARGDLDEILGVVHAKDILNALFDGQVMSLKTMMRPALTVPDSTSVLRLLDQFKQSGQHIAIVVDEYGSIEGLVSVTDIVESITGELPEPGEISGKPVKREDGSWLIDGSTPIDEVEHLIGLKSMRGEGDFHTLAGFIVDRLGHLPNAGDHFTWEDTRFEVVDMDARRVDKVLVTNKPVPAQET